MFVPPIFNNAALILNQYLRGVLDPIPNVFCWQHRGFSEPSRDLYLSDGVHVNSPGLVLVVSQLSGRPSCRPYACWALSTRAVKPFPCLLFFRGPVPGIIYVN